MDEDELDKPLTWVHGEILSPPFSTKARREAGFLLRQLQHGVSLTLPHSRPMPEIETGVHELRVPDDGNVDWRIIYFLGEDVIVVLDVFKKKTDKTPDAAKRACKQRLSEYRRARRLER